MLRYLRRLHDSRETIQSTCTTEVTDSDGMIIIVLLLLILLLLLLPSLLLLLLLLLSLVSSDDDEYNISISLQSEMMKKKLNEGG